MAEGDDEGLSSPPVVLPPTPPILWSTSTDLKYKSPPDLLYPLDAEDTWTPSPGGRQNQSQKPLPELLCYACFAPDPKLRCSRCGVASYCNKDCQKRDWKCKAGCGYHKANCEQMKLLTRSGTFPSEASRRSAAEAGMLSKVKMYMCPFAVYNHSGKGPGFVFLQSPDTLEQLSMPGNGLRDCRGGTRPDRLKSREILMQYMKVEEFSSLIEDDFELTALQPSLTAAVSAADPTETVVVLVRVRCGFVGVCTMKLVLGYAVCMKLGEEYEGRDTLQMNIDDI
mmetsp:Transcript_23730/g.49394  ORF Transcript_23730/g.49394 Transcript_23730/m.49394 type:complete len:282 (+) Transcript_23730:121-966(+)